LGAINKPTTNVKITNDITLGFIKLSNDFRKVIKSYKKAGDWHWNPIKKCEIFEDWYDMETITVEQVKEAIDYVAT